MKAAMPAPMMTSASRTLTAAMIPSSRLVVPSSPVMCASERRRLAARKLRGWTRFAKRVVQQLPSLARDPGGLLDRRAEAHELTREVLQRRLDLSPDATPMVGEEQVAGDPPDYRTYQCGCQFARIVHLPSC